MTTPVSVNAADVDQVAAAGTRADARERERLEETRDALDTYIGRRRYWRLVAGCGVFTDITGDAETVARALGRRAVGLALLEAAMAHPDLFLQMQTEAMRRDKTERAEALSARTRRSDAPAPEAS